MKNYIVNQNVAQLCKASWESIALQWKTHLHSTHDPENAIESLVENIRVHLNCFQMLYVFAKKMHPDEHDSLNGWRPIQTVNLYMNHKESHIAVNWAQDISNIIKDIATITITQYAGTHRTLIREDILGEAPWQEAHCHTVFEPYGITDRMVSGVPLDDETELFFVFDRNKDEPNFTRKDQQYIHTILSGIQPLAYQLAMSYGYLMSQQRFSPRERQTMLSLLEGWTEKEIAAQMGVTPQTLHQYVVAIYRKCGLNSRAQLMSQWICLGQLDSIDD